MDVSETEIPGLLVIEPRVHRDERGYFLETWNQRRYPPLPPFVQDNLSYSRQGVLRGLHYQHPRGQGKLVGVTRGEVFDVAVDLRRGSPTFGRWWGTTLSAANARQLYIPVGCAHGFLVLSHDALFAYKCTGYYVPEDEMTVLWSDPEIAIEWPAVAPMVSPKDRKGWRLRDLREENLPEYRGPGVVAGPDADAARVP